MKITLTGGAGVLGRNLVSHLMAARHEVTSLDLSPMPETPGCTQIIGDIRDPATVARAVAGADIVIHAAAALPSYRPADIRSISVGGTEVVMAACHREGIGRVIHVSSSAVYGLPDIVPTPEDHPRQRVDPYNCAKIDAEKVCEQYRAEGMVVPILRPKTFLGPHRLGIFAMLFEWAEEGRHFPLIGGGQYRSQLLDVDDLVTAVDAVMSLPDATVNDAFNIAAAEFTTLHDDFQAVLDAAGHGKRVIALPAAPAIAILRALELSGVSPVYKRLIYKLSRDAYAATTKAETVLGVRPRVSSRDAIVQSFRWWQAQNRSRSSDGRAAPNGQTGRTSREPWKQGALGLAKALF
ncbi:NAD-dependent epimerase/dehydratase family protein [Salipiger sp. 1_MG-2023]|uniref:NAD-dependent epimerase/dehydratase family protein n=1 Tax=Salipiger sp. 1_MG-2023 TaxID=3062665 RepID=UPI0026E4225A|nr:NAD-dependent epimerase/dehydratase family protein [Salipiger sp. 1_MG-2023]MDO6588243.1 NAD-dependent epimerase/dehydratase family protein [Salipiger sp. 1_MG-2023]